MKKLVWFEEVGVVVLGLLALAGAMSGCGAVEAGTEDRAPVDGGGGGGGGGRGGSREDDVEAPAVGETIPADGATKVPTNTTVRLRFSEPMDSESLASAFTVSLEGPIDGVVRYDEDTDTATFTPASDLRAGKTYTATIGADARDAAGNPLESSRTWSFTTEDFIYRVSVSSEGEEGDDHSYDCWGCSVVSGDGRYVAFASIAANLVDDDSNQAPDIFRHDWQTGETIRVSVPNATDRGKLGNESDAESRMVAISGDGRYVAFTSRAGNLVADDTNGQWNVFVHDVDTGTTTLVSVPNAADRGDLGAWANGDSYRPSLSTDGRFVAFESTASNLVLGDDNGDDDVFVYDRETGVTELVSASSNGVPGNSWSLSASLSGDGRYVAFVSEATNLDSAQADTNDQRDVFVRDRDTATTTRVSIGFDGSEAGSASFAPVISEDGRYVTFTSLADNLVRDDTSRWTDVFVHDRMTGTTKRVSVPNQVEQNELGTEANHQSLSRAISADGRYVTFVSFASNLVGNDTNGDYDVFVHDTMEGLTRRMSLAADGTQIEIESFYPDNVTSPPVSMSADGRYVVFSTDFSDVVEGDTNASMDVYRVLNAPLPDTPSPRCPDLTPAKLVLHGEPTVRIFERMGPRLELLLENLGNRSAQDYAITFYLSEDEEITEDDLWLGTIFPDAVGAGESLRVPLRGVYAKEGLPHGPLWLGVIVDMPGDLAECNEDNNVAAVPVTYGCRDIGPASLEWLGDFWIRPGETVGDRLAAIVENLGDLPSGGLGFDVNFYISPDEKITRGDQRLFNAREFVSGSLAPGEQEDISVDPSASIPADWPLGRAYFGILVDELDAIDECDEGNNTASVQITVAEHVNSDLVVTDFTLSSRMTVTRGEDIGPRVAATVQNMGADPTGTFASGLYLSHDEYLDGGDAQLGPLRWIPGGLPGGGSRELFTGGAERIIPDNWFVGDGDAYLLVYVDVEHATSELSRINNWQVIPVTVN